LASGTLSIQQQIYTDRFAGTGLFVGSGAALQAGGPASLVIAYGLIGVMLFCTVQALGEMAVAFPVAGSFAVYASRFIDPAWGFAMAWK
jgi:amino acid transporter